MKDRLIPLFSVTLVSVVCLAAEPAKSADANDGWKLATERNGVTIYSRHHSGSFLKEFKAMGEIAAPSRAVCEVIDFFFSSRRRHTSWTGDWSSDVCSSDLRRSDEPSGGGAAVRAAVQVGQARRRRRRFRSEERRVGKECRPRWSAYSYKEAVSVGNERSTLNERGCYLITVTR